MKTKIHITGNLCLDPGEIEFKFSRASGPGGQNVNKVSSAVQLRFNVTESKSLPDEIRSRVMNSSKSKINSDGVLIINARRFRNQHKNREDALERLLKILRKAAEPRKKRLKTKPPRQAKENRLKAKHQQSEKKKQRGKIPDWDE